MLVIIPILLSSLVVWPKGTIKNMLDVREVLVDSYQVSWDRVIEHHHDSSRVTLAIYIRYLYRLLMVFVGIQSLLARVVFHILLNAYRDTVIL